MRASEQQKEAIYECVKDLQNYYETCGNDLDFENLEILKTFLNCTTEPVENIEVFYKGFVQPEKIKK
jgi:hypothetical protein